MSLWQNASSTKSHPFSFYLEQAAESGGHGDKVNPSPRGMVWTAAGYIHSGWQWLQRMRAAQTTARRLRVTETVSLGEKRFLSIVQVDEAQFLIGSSATNVQLLAQLAPQIGEVARMRVEPGESA